MTAQREPSDALRAALVKLAAADVPELVEQARRRANARAAELIEDALVQELLRAAGRLRSASRGESPAEVSSEHESSEHESSEQAWWAYCVIRSKDASAIPEDLEGIAPGTGVEVVTEGELSALVSEVPLAHYNDERLREHLEDLGWVERTARAHEAVLERTLHAVTIVPLRLCTLYRDLDGVRRLLRESGEALGDGLAAIEGCVELGLKVFALPGQLAAAEPPEPSAERFGATGPGAGAAYLSRRQHERERVEQARELRTQCVETVHEHVGALARAAMTNRPQHPEAHGRDGEMILNGAYLVERDRVSEVGDAVAVLREQWEPHGFEVEFTGPSPAYNFVSGAAGIVP